jgi:hypothetical protein
MSFLTKRAVGDDFGVTFGPIEQASPIYVLKFGVQAITGAEGSEALLQEAAGRYDTLLFRTSEVEAASTVDTVLAP